MKKVYYINNIVDCSIDKIDDKINELSDDEKNRLKIYLSTRRKEFGFHEKEEWRFYFCSHPLDVEKGFHISGIRASKYTNLEEIPVKRNK